MNPDAVICMRRQDCQPELMIAGATPDVCTRCGEAVMVSPSGREIASKFVCVPCARELQELRPLDIIGPTPAQIAELAAHYGGGQ